MRRFQRGGALLIVLWACVLLSVLTGGYAASARFEALQARQLLNQVRAHYAVEATLMQALASLVQGPAPALSLPTDGSIRTVRWQGLTLYVAIRDERGKIDLNHASAALLQRWLTRAGVADAPEVAGMIVAWRSPPTTAGQQQRVARMYRDAGADYGPRGSPFTDPEELARIPLLDSGVLERLLPDATVWSDLEQPDPRFASPSVVAAIHGLESDAFGGLAERPAGIEPYGATQSLEIQAADGGTVSAGLSVTVRLQPGETPDPFAVLRWKEDGWP